MAVSTAELGAGCPAWCACTHGSVRHYAVFAEAHLDGMAVTVALSHAEWFDGRPSLGPHASIDILVDGIGMELDLTPGQVQLLERAFNADGGAEYFGAAFAAVATALDGQTGR